MTCSKADQLMAGRLITKANAISSCTASGKERGSDESPWREAVGEQAVGERQVGCSTQAVPAPLLPGHVH